MKIIVRIALFLLVLAALVAGSLRAGWVGFLTQEHRDWAFIESVGGMRVSLDDRALKVDCDVSGIRKVTKDPTLMNSGIGVRRLKCQREGGVLRLSVITSVIEKGMTASCGGVDLSDDAKGDYAVEYLDPDGTTHALGTITLQ